MNIAIVLMPDNFMNDCIWFLMSQMAEHLPARLQSAHSLKSVQKEEAAKGSVTKKRNETTLPLNMWVLTATVDVDSMLYILVASRESLSHGKWK